MDTIGTATPQAAPPMPSGRPLMSGRPFGPHLLLGELIGRGGMSRVYRGWVSDTGREVAVKVLRDELATKPDAVRRFVRERDLLATVAGPHVVRVHDLVVHGDELGIVMDLVPGGQLRRAVGFPCPLATAAELAAQIADGLAAVHSAGVVHRDLKPENVLVETDGSGGRTLRLTDFGISRLMDSVTHTQTSVTGTPGYLAPEVAAGRRVTAAADVYALGVMLYEMCCGRQPFVAANPLLLVLAHTRQLPPRPLGMPDALWRILDGTLAKDPAARPGAVEVARGLRMLAPGLLGLSPCTVPVAIPEQVDLPALEPTPEPTREQVDLPVLARVPSGPEDRTGADGRTPGSGRHSPAPRPRTVAARRRIVAAAAVLVTVAVAATAVAAFTLSGPSSPALPVPPSPQPTVTRPTASPDARAGVVTRTHRRRRAPSHASTSPLAPSPSPSPAASATGGTATSRPAVSPPATPTLTSGSVTPQDQHSMDQRADLAVGGVSTPSGTVTSITVRYTAAGQPPGSRAVPVASTPTTTYPVTVDGLVNGTTYTFTAVVCNSGGRCATSAPLDVTPYPAPQVVAPTLASAGLAVTVSVLAEIRGANPGMSTCDLIIAATPAGRPAPRRPVSPDGDTVTFTGTAGARYTATETCTTAGVPDGSATSLPLTIPAA